MSKVLNKSRASILEDLVFILYLLPIIIPIVYSLLLWPNMGQETYLKVTREPIVFIIGIISICIAILIDVKESETNDKLKLLRVNRKRIIKLFYSTIILSIIIAWISTGYQKNLITLIIFWTKGKFAVIYPLFLYLAYISISPSLKVNKLELLKLQEFIAPSLMLISPIILTILVRNIGISFSTSMILTTIIMMIGIILMVKPRLLRKN